MVRRSSDLLDAGDVLMDTCVDFDTASLAAVGGRQLQSGAGVPQRFSRVRAEVELR